MDPAGHDQWSLQQAFSIFILPMPRHGRCGDRPGPQNETPWGWKHDRNHDRNLHPPGPFPPRLQRRLAGASGRREFVVLGMVGSLG